MAATGDKRPLADGVDPKTKIRLHFDGLRTEWGVKWKFFGSVSVPVVTPALTDAIERALWAGYILRAFSGARFTEEPDAMTMAEGFGDSVGDKVLENAILARLRRLNVVVAETYAEAVAQFANRQAPAPTTRIDGEVDTRSEVDRLKLWAQDYLNTLDRDAQMRFFPAATKRVILPLQYV